MGGCSGTMGGVGCGAGLSCRIVWSVSGGGFLFRIMHPAGYDLLAWLVVTDWVVCSLGYSVSACWLVVLAIV